MSKSNCDHCGDPAVIHQEYKERFWPFKVIESHSYCYECYQELVNGKLPKLTDSPYRSRKGSGVTNRRRKQS